MALTENYPHKDIVRAYLDGKEIEVLRHDNKWATYEMEAENCMPRFFADEQYRIKPSFETKTIQIRLITTTNASNYVDFLSRDYTSNEEIISNHKEKTTPDIIYLTDWFPVTINIPS